MGPKIDPKWNKNGVHEKSQKAREPRRQGAREPGSQGARESGSQGARAGPGREATNQAMVYVAF